MLMVTSFSTCSFALGFGSFVCIAASLLLFWT